MPLPISGDLLIMYSASRAGSCLNGWIVLGLGFWAVIFGRRVPGFRVAVTVVAASFEIRYRVFIGRVAISAAVWVTVFMTLGLLVGHKAEQLLGTHQYSSLAILAAVMLVGLVLIVGREAWQRRRKGASQASAPAPQHHV